MHLKSVLGVAAGGSAGALLRWGAAAAAARCGIGTSAAVFAVNIAGCFAFGYLAAGGAGGVARNAAGSEFWLVGVLGGFTTFSAFAGIVAQDAAAGVPLRGIGYAAVHVAAGAAALALGAKLA